MEPIVCPDPQRLAAYVQQALAPDELRAIDAHLQQCAGCRMLVLSLRQVPELPTHTVQPAPGDTSRGGERGSAPPSDAVPSGVAESLGELGEYRLLAKLGEGGMGAVYKALHTRLDKIVALKLLPERQETNDWAISRFEREMKAIGRLNHPNVIQAYDARQIGTTRFLVTEYVDGIDLGELLRRRGPLPLAAACELVRQAALGLQAAHELGLVHRDVKPSNLMLTRHGQVKVLDLGLARLQSSRVPPGELTSSGQIMGTADYMAPEQVSDSHRVDIRADIYSLGCTLYKLLTGEVLFGGPEYESPFEKMSAQVLKAPPPLRRLRPDAPAALTAVVERMLAKKPADRYATPAEVAAVLGPLTAGNDLGALWDEEAAPQAAPAEARAWNEQRRRQKRRLAWGAIGIGGALLGGAIWFALIGVGPHSPDDPDRPKGKAREPASSVYFREKPHRIPKPVRPKTEARLLEDGTPAPAVAPFDADQARPYQELWAKHLNLPVEQTNAVGMKLALIPPGEFDMGSDEDELGFGRVHFVNESPAHRVKIGKPFYLGLHEVTQAQYQKVQGGNPSYFSASGEGRNALSGDTSAYPVESVSHAQAEEFCRKLSLLPEEHSAWRRYRLPTEAEWEYACRAGTTTFWYFGDNPLDLGPYARFASGHDTPQAVGQTRPNAWGLYDMLGNVFEWCGDWYARDYYPHAPQEDPRGPASGLEYVIRGGSYWNQPDFCRCAFRSGALNEGGQTIGFRVLCEVSTGPGAQRAPSGK